MQNRNQLQGIQKASAITKINNALLSKLSLNELQKIEISKLYKFHHFKTIPTFMKTIK